MISFYWPKRILNRLDWILVILLSLLMVISLFVVYSASGSMEVVNRQVIRIILGFIAMVFVANISADNLQRLAPVIYCAGVILLTLVLLIGLVGKGAQRWVAVGGILFQPAEIMKLGVPMMAAWVLIKRPLPPTFFMLISILLVVFIPTGLIYLQPDLGTSILVAGSGVCILIFAGLSWRYVLSGLVLIGGSLPVLWHFMHEYQKKRVLTLFDPWQDPLGSGYHTIQSIIAIGSGGASGKGWRHGTQSQLDFLPEQSTDFIFAVIAEEFGFVGVVTLMILYLLVLFRCVQLMLTMTDTYNRLVASALTMTFFFYIFVNIGMVSGVLPVVGVPLPLISYGGTSMLTIMTGFGIIMSLARQKRLMTS